MVYRARDDLTHVFVSYVREDRALVDRLCDDLRGQGAEIWLDREKIEPGSRWKDAVRNAVREGSSFLACFSKAYESRSKSYMNEELTLAIEELRQFPSERVWFVPILLTECDVPARSIGAGETLLDIHWVQLYEDWDQGVKRIIQVIKPEKREKAKEHLVKLARRLITRSSWVSEEVWEGDLDPDDDSDDEDAELKALEKEYRTSVEEFQTEFGERYDPYSDRFP